MSHFEIPDNLAISDSGFLFSASTGESFTLNKIGNEIISLLHQGKSKEEILNSILDEYEIDKKTFEKDFEDFLSQLKNFSLIKEL
jgi:PqqD family protein of HPr-rel-A system